MELLLLLIAGVLIATPIIALVALLRTGRLRERLDFAEREIEHLRDRLRNETAKVAAQPARAAAAQPAQQPQTISPAADDSKTESVDRAHETKVPEPPPPQLTPVMRPTPVLPPILPATAAIPVAPPPLPPLPPIPVLRAQEMQSAKIPFIMGPDKPPTTTPLSQQTAKPSPPPTPEDSREKSESHLGAWWATRIGITFLIAAVVSFGVYVSKHSPTMQVLVVFSLACAITVAGWWAERKTAIFGQVLFAGGLAMMYFTAFASYAVSGMKIVEDVRVGIMLQFAAVGVVTAVALWRNRTTIATMAIFLGEISCLFALSERQYHWTLGAALGLLVVSALLRVGRGWAWPLACGYAGAQLCYAAAVLALLGHVLDPAAGAIAAFGPGAEGLDASVALWYPLAFFAVLVGGDVSAQALGRASERTAREWMARVAALAYGAGAWWGGQALRGEGAASFNLLVASAACLAAGVLYWRRGELEGIGEMFLAAAGSWLAVHFVIEYSGTARWAALLAEAFVFAAWLLRRRSVFAWLGLLLVWLLSGFMALLSAVADGPFFIESLDQAAIFALWPLASAGLWAWLAGTARTLGNDEREWLNSGSWAGAVLGVLIGFAAWGEGLEQWLFLALAAVAALPAWRLRSVAFARLAGLALAASWVDLLTTASPEWYQWMIPLAEAFLLAVLVRNRGSWSRWLLLTGAWSVSGLVAALAAWNLGLEAAPWAVGRMLFAVWPLTALLLWSLLERPGRELAPEEKLAPAFGVFMTVVASQVLCIMAWTGDARAWQFFLLAGASAALVRAINGRTGWVMPGVALLSAIWTFHLYPAAPIGAETNATVLVLGLLLAPVVFSIAALAAAALIQRRASGSPHANAAIVIEWIFSLSLLRLWAVVLQDPAFALPAAPIALAVLALALAGLAARGPWRALADTAWFWSAAALYLWWETQDASTPLKTTAWTCLAATVALAWVWGVLARRPQPAVRLLRLDVAGLFLPSVLLIGWTWTIQALSNTDAGRAQDAILAASLYALLARRDLLPSAAVSAVVIAIRAWLLSLGLELADLRDCITPALVMAGLLFIGWIAKRRIPKAFPETVPATPGALLMLALCALAAFVVPVWRVESVEAQKYVTLLWGIAAGACFAAGLAARLKPYRYAGLLGLAWCLPRLFIVDITDTFSRILAFGALAVVLLAIGFSYERLRAWIDDDAQKTGNDETAGKDA